MKVQKFLHQLNDSLQQSFNIILPDICLNCNEKISLGSKYLCSQCIRELPFIKKPICSFCGALLQELYHRSVFDAKCPFCTSNDYYFDQCRSGFVYNDSIQTLIKNFKYNEMTGIAKILINPLIPMLQDLRLFLQVDHVIPVPLHPVRKRERGFNQSELLAKLISNKLALSYNSTLVKRIRYTKSQTYLQGTERITNVQSAFSVDKNTSIKNNNVLIVDDVYTTGATVNAISRELKSRQVRNVYVFTIARAGLLP